MTSKTIRPLIGLAICISIFCGCTKKTDVSRPNLPNLSKEQITHAYTYYINRNFKAMGLPGIGNYKVDPDKDYLTNKDAALEAYRQNSSSKKRIIFSY